MREFIQQAAAGIGFDACGFAKAEELTEDADFLQSWLSKGMHGDMHFLERNFEKRTNPRLLVPDCKTVIVLLLNYFPDKLQHSDSYKIAKYAYSEIDYHFVVREKLRLLEKMIADEAGNDCFATDYQHSFIDSAPVLERRWAQKAGLGWIGKHTQLIAPGFGSYVFIATLMMNRELDSYDESIRDRCGTCTKCIDACPTQALVPRILDARRCISYLTIESKSEPSTELKSKLSGYTVGCDICADVCPWNKKWAVPHLHKELSPSEPLMRWTDEEWKNAGPELLRNAFKKSAVLRAFKNQKKI